MREIALHLLDIAENSVAAHATAIQIRVSEDLHADRLSLSVKDNGKGMDAETVARVIDPFVTSRTTRKVGLGIPLFKAAAEACNGSLSNDSTVGEGTTLYADFQHSHIDRMPLGDISSTFLSMLIAHPDIHWLFDYSATSKDGNSSETFSFDDEPVKETLEGLPLTEPAVLEYLHEVFDDGIASTQKTLI